MSYNTDIHIDLGEFADRYTAVWNEPDPAARRQAIAALWAQDGVEFTESAAHRGHEAIEARIANAHEDLVKRGGYVFAYAGDATGHHDAVRFTVHMRPAGGGDIAWTGAVLIQRSHDGRIQRDYQFTLANPPAGAGEPDDPRSATRSTVEDLLRRMVEGDPDRLAELFAETVDWNLNWPARDHPAVPWIRARSTRAQVADHFHMLRAYHVPELNRGSVARIVVDGPDAVVMGTIQQTVKATGVPYTALYSLHVTVEHGRITRYHVYEDSLTVAEAHSGTAGTGPDVRPRADPM